MIETEPDAFLFWWEATFCLVIKSCLLKHTEPFNQLRSVKISLCMEANIWTQEKEDDQCSVSLSVFSLIPQDNSVSAPTPSLLSHAWICLSLSLSLCLLSQILLTLTPLTFLSIYRLPHKLNYSPVSSSSCSSSSSPPSLPQDCCVYSSSRSPPTEDGDVSHRRG